MGVGGGGGDGDTTKPRAIAIVNTVLDDACITLTNNPKVSSYLVSMAVGENIVSPDVKISFKLYMYIFTLSNVYY